MCAGARLGDTDPDTATGKEGDVEARCFRGWSPGMAVPSYDLPFGVSRTRFTTRPGRGHTVPTDGFRSAAWSRDQKPNGKGWFGHQYCVVNWSEVVGGESQCRTTHTQYQ